MARIRRLRTSKIGLLVLLITQLAIAYGFASLAIDRGNFLWYLLALIFLVGALHNLFRLIGTLVRRPHGRR